MHVSEDLAVDHSLLKMINSVEIKDVLRSKVVVVKMRWSESVIEVIVLHSWCGICRVG